MAFLCPCVQCHPAAKRQILRLRLNWFFIMMLGSLYGLSYTAFSSTFHQYMTNPTAQNLNQSAVNIEPGLGQSEVFYSWVIATFNVGALVGALGTGLATKYIPYWHIILVGLISHTVGYVIYPLATTGWLIIISKFLSGLFVGQELTVALAYFAESSLDYQAAHKALGNSKVKSDTIRNRLFALHNIGVDIGYVLGPGAAAIFTQFDIDQFRSIAWYNVAAGVLFVALLVLLFHGEAGCSEIRKRRHNCCKKFNASWKLIKLPSGLNTRCLEFLILLFLIICCAFLSFRFGAYETVYNPVLSDYFGFTERDSSYFFFGLVFAQISGTLTLLLLQYIKLNNRVIAIVGLLISIAGAAILADWQSIPNDPCTQLSPFHHPDLVDAYSNMSSKNSPGMLNEVDPGSLMTVEEILYENKHAAHSQALEVLNADVYTIAMNVCESAVVPHHQCYWVPNSRVTKHHCGDCQPICRSIERSLNFVQFVFGASLLMVAIPIAWVPIVGLISDRVPRKSQGIVIGTVMALCALCRSIGPLWLDAAYELLHKRTVLASGILIALHLPFLVGILVLYHRLVPTHSLYRAGDRGKEEEEEGEGGLSEVSSDDDHSDSADTADENKQLVPQ